MFSFPLIYSIFQLVAAVLAIGSKLLLYTYRVTIKMYTITNYWLIFSLNKVYTEDAYLKHLFAAF